MSIQILSNNSVSWTLPASFKLFICLHQPIAHIPSSHVQEVVSGWDGHLWGGGASSIARTHLPTWVTWTVYRLVEWDVLRELLTTVWFTGVITGSNDTCTLSANLSSVHFLFVSTIFNIKLFDISQSYIRSSKMVDLLLITASISRYVLKRVSS